MATQTPEGGDGQRDNERGMSETRTSYLEVARRLEDAGVSLEAGSEKERLAIERFEGLLGDFKAPDFVARIRQVYAENVYFNDTLKTIRGVDESRPTWPTAPTPSRWEPWSSWTGQSQMATNTSAG